MVRGSVPLELNWECHRLLNWFQFHCTVVLASVGLGCPHCPHAARTLGLGSVLGVSQPLGV